MPDPSIVQLKASLLPVMFMVYQNVLILAQGAWGDLTLAPPSPLLSY